MIYHIGRDGAQLGTFPEEELRKGLETGAFLPGDLAWSEGMTDWKPLSEVLNLNPASGGSRLSTVPSPSDIAAPVTPPQPGIVPPPAMTGHVGIGMMPAPGTAIASLVLGIVSMVTCYFGLLFAIPGLICGHLAMSQIKNSGGRLEGRGMALAGLILSYIWIGLALLAVAFLAFAGIIAANSSS